ncbi:hypothetical protein M1L60_08545 [Actinoplanes sp. TRM 88003]|uniref:Uncharacterized protein n=1 Tax=Paractinoplanes aksuensis TaxID=2939490 RepID=A0ABT1DIJ6_9ACTN|nr:hypothetical protein [Actinoplanes aksuensis]MCO8270646.1 hypothetical protein [Actinoplanes aksuensis]
MTTEDVRLPRTAQGFAERMAYACQKDPAEIARRVRVRRVTTALLVGWAVIVPILVVYGVTGRRHEPEIISIAAALTVGLPFLAAVIATHGRRFGLGGTYVVLTLLMVLPAIWVAQLR